MLLSPDVVRRYQEVGYAFLPQVIEPKWLTLIEKGIQRNLDHPSPWSTAYQKSRGHFFSDHSNFSVNPEFQEVIYDSPIVDYLTELMGTDRSWLYYDQIFYKTGEAVRTGWHQDMPYYLMEPGMQVTGAWLTLDPLPKEFTLEVVARSHTGPLYNAVNGKKPTEMGFNVGGEQTPDIEANRKAFDIVSFDHKPGDLLVLHPQLLHGGAPMAPGMGRRRTMTLNIFGPEMRYQTRPDGYAPTFPGLEKVLKPGDPLHWAADKGLFHQLRPLPAKRLGVLPDYDMPHGGKPAEAA
jgi:ectoine hydroxylase-related dioxygenase (phytanoyl-CoA dioxygenase family)